MPQAANITVNDGTDNVVLTPDMITSAHAVFQNMAVPVLNQRELLHFDRPSSENGKTRRRQIRISTPVEVTDSEGKVTVETLTFACSIISPVNVSSADRQRIRTLGANALQDAIVASVFDDPTWVF